MLNLETLKYCRATWCTREDLHLSHGRGARLLKAARGTPAAPAPGPDVEVDEGATCDGPGVGAGLITTVLRHVGYYVPTSFAEVWDRVNHDYGPVADRSIQRALRFLIEDRQVASLGSAAWARDHQRSGDQPGFYLHYDSPKLWKADGLADLMGVVATLAQTGEGGRPRSRVATLRGPHLQRAEDGNWSITRHLVVAARIPTQQEVEDIAAEFS